MWSLLHNPSAYPSARTHTSSVVGSCFTYKLGMLPVLRFQAELSPSFLWKFTEFRAETPPPCLWNSKLRYPPTSSEFQSKKPPLSLRIPRCRPWYGMDIFWNHPQNCTYSTGQYRKKQTCLDFIFAQFVISTLIILPS